MRPLLPLAALVLCACQPQAPDGAAATEPADAPSAALAPPPTVLDLSQPIRALGTEPFWAVEIDGTALTLKRPDQPDAVFEAPGATVAGGQASWEARRADGAVMKVTLFVSECSDGMSDRRYPLTAEVEVGAETFRGCAAKTAELMAGPAP